MLTVVSQQESGRVQGEPGGSGSPASSVIDEIVREGARAMLAAALRAEVAAYVEAHAHEVDADGHRLVVRNGYAQPREVLTSSGAVEVVAPRVNDKRVDEAVRMAVAGTALGGESLLTVRLLAQPAVAHVNGTP